MRPASNGMIVALYLSINLTLYGSAPTLPKPKALRSCGEPAADLVDDFCDIRLGRQTIDKACVANQTFRL